MSWPTSGNLRNTFTVLFLRWAKPAILQVSPQKAPTKARICWKPSGVIEASYSRWSSFLTAAIWRDRARVKRRPAGAGGANERVEHEFEHGLFAEAVRDEFKPPALPGEQPVEGGSCPKSLYLHAKTACG